VIVDGAHNLQAMETLMAELCLLVPEKRVIFLFGVMRDKEWRAMVPVLGRIASEVVVTAVAQPRAEDPHTVHSVFSSHCRVRVITGAQVACRQLLSEAGPQDVIVVCGSLFLVGEVLPLFPDSTIDRRERAALERYGIV
jgi:dihydrofolate synthase/folylpolyglutamate synthase